MLLPAPALPCNPIYNFWRSNEFRSELPLTSIYADQETKILRDLVFINANADGRFRLVREILSFITREELTTSSEKITAEPEPTNQWKQPWAGIKPPPNPWGPRINPPRTNEWFGGIMDQKTTRAISIWFEIWNLSRTNAGDVTRNR